RRDQRSTFRMSEFGFRISIVFLLATVSCDSRTPVQRGADLFRPAAEKLGEAHARDLKAKAENAYRKLLEETKSKDEAELGRVFGKDFLRQFGPALAVTPEQERAFKDGK